MIGINVEQKTVRAALASYPVQASRALEITIDKTAYEVRDDMRTEMKRVFDNPTRFTLNSLKVTKTRNHNMKASVWFKEPDRMEDHYLIPQVEGGQRKLKGFERGLNRNRFIPGDGARVNKFGNISPGQIRQVLSVLGKAELTPGYQANITSKSAKTNKKSRDYVFLHQGSSGGKLPPGIYERTTQKGTGFGGSAKKSIGSFGNYQKGTRKKKFFSVVRARGLKPIMLLGRQRRATKPLLKFYTVSKRTHARVFNTIFYQQLSKQLSK